jgi:hypothetical protein
MAEGGQGAQDVGNASPQAPAKATWRAKLWHWVQGGREAKRFHDWCEKTKQINAPKEKTPDDRFFGPGHEHTKEYWQKRITDILKNGETISLNMAKWPTNEIEIIGDRNAGSKGLIYNIIEYGKKSVKIKDCYISQLSINGNGRFKLYNCYILKIVIHSEQASAVKLKNSWIGTLAPRSNSLSRLSIVGGGVLGFECPTPHQDAPFVGPVTFKNVYFPRRKKGSYIGGAQTYTNVKAHLAALQNVQAANLMHAHEQDIERESDTRFNRLVGLLYSFASRYGTSLGRPFAWFIGLVLVSFVLIVAVDGAEMTNGADAALIGWRAALVGEGCGARILRSAVLALQSILSPVLIFGGKPLLVAGSTWLAIVLFIVGLIEAAALFLFFLALRRRFRMHS